MKRTTLFSLFSILSHRAYGRNNWTQPCFNGACSYDVAHNATSMGGTISISGPSTAISDITPAAGWSILNCTTSTNTQTIQVVCTDESKGCNHLFQQGAEHTIVRLPEDCGLGPFVRVAKHSVPVNQSLPNHVASRIRRSDGSTPQVQLLQIDTKFNESASSGQTVGFSLTVSSANPTSSGSSSLAPSPTTSRRRMRDLHRRATRTLGDGTPTKRFSIPGIPINIPIPSISLPTPTFDHSQSLGGQPVTFSKSFELFNKTLSCAGDEHENEEVTLKVDVATDVDLTPTFSFEVGGTILPPAVKKFDATGTVDGTFGASLSVDADLVGTLSTGEISLFTVGLPVFSVPDIFTIGPQFALNAEATATFELDAELSIGLQYQLNGLSFTVGSSQSSKAGFVPGDSPVSFSVDPSITAKASFEAHLIPTVSFGVSAFSNNLDVFINLDAGLEVDLNATVSADLTGVVGGGATASESAEACVDILSPISFNIGATGNLFDIIDETLNVPIYEKSFDIYQKCFTQAAKTTIAPAPTPTPASFHCFEVAGVQALIFPQTIPAASKNSLTFAAGTLQAQPCTFSGTVPTMTGICFSAGNVLAEVVGDVGGIEAKIVQTIDQLQESGLSAVGCPGSAAFTATSASLPVPTSTSPPPVCFDANGVTAMIPNDLLPESALVWQLFLAVPCPTGVTLPTPSNPGICLDVEGTMLPIIGSDMTSATQIVKAIGFNSSTLSVVTCPSNVFTPGASTSASSSTISSTTHLTSVSSSSTIQSTTTALSTSSSATPSSSSSSTSHTSVSSSSTIHSTTTLLTSSTTVSASSSTSVASHTSATVTSSTLSFSAGNMSSTAITTTSSVITPTTVTPTTVFRASSSPLPSGSDSSNSLASSAPSVSASINTTLVSTSLPTSSSKPIVPTSISLSSSTPSTSHSILTTTSSQATSTTSVGSQGLNGTSSTPLRIVEPTTSAFGSVSTSLRPTSIESSSQVQSTSSFNDTSGPASSSIYSPLPESSSTIVSSLSSSSSVIVTESTIHGVLSSSTVEQPSSTSSVDTTTLSSSQVISNVTGTGTSDVFGPTQTSIASSSAGVSSPSSLAPITTVTASESLSSSTERISTSEPAGTTTDTPKSTSLSSTLASFSTTATSLPTTTSSSAFHSAHTTSTSSSHSAGHTPSRPPPPPPPKPAPRPHNKYPPGNHHTHRPSQHQRPSQFQNPEPHRGPGQSGKPGQNQGPERPGNSFPEPSQRQGSSPYQNYGGYGGNMYESSGPSQSNGKGGYYGGFGQPANTYPAPGQHQGPSQNQRPSPYQSYGGNMYESMGSGQNEGGYYGEPNAYQPSYGGVGGYTGDSQRIGYGGVQSWSESTRYYRKRQMEAETPFAKRAVFARDFSCPASSATDSSPISESSTVPAASA